MRTWRVLVCVGWLCAVVGGCGGDEASPAESEADTTGEEALSGGAPDGPEEGLPEGFPPPAAERASMTAQECQAAGGSLVGDIGNGAIHRPDYRCPDGQVPSGTVPLGTEGSVCCPASP
ncbi:MAG: hypothetical protein AB8I08_41010 [Sandaracinaceae bacterium]